jgi:hypothetical protein
MIWMMKVFTELVIYIFVGKGQKVDHGYFCAGLKAISRCRKLSSLKIGICLKISDEGLTHIGKSCPELRDVDLYR